MAPTSSRRRRTDDDDDGGISVSPDFPGCNGSNGNAPSAGPDHRSPSAPPTTGTPSSPAPTAPSSGVCNGSAPSAGSDHRSTSPRTTSTLPVRSRFLDAHSPSPPATTTASSSSHHRSGHQASPFQGVIRSRSSARSRPPGQQSRGRWDQPPPPPPPPRCSSCHSREHAVEMVMTCCRALLCAGCAEVSPCACREWQDGFGSPVPILPAHPVPEDCILEHPVMLRRPRWQLFYTSRAGDHVMYAFYNVSHAFHGSQNIACQVHRYETIGVSGRWHRLYCRIVEIPDRNLLFSFYYPPQSQADVDTLNDLARAYRSFCSRYP